MEERSIVYSVPGLISFAVGGSMGACIADGSSEGCGDGSDASGLDCQQGAGAKCAAGTNADAQGCTVGSIANSCLVTGNDATVVCVSTGSGGDAPE